MKRKYVYIIIALAILAVIFVVYKLQDKSETAEITVPVKKGRLEITVTTTGELQALNSEDIKGPYGMRQAGVWQVKITDLIAEGTEVKAGDYIATLDKSEVSTKLRDLANELSKIESQYTQTRLDTALEMRKLRDDLLNLQFDLDQKKLQVEQSKYEPPAIIKQAELEYEKIQRTMEQSRTNYKLKLQQNRAKMQEVASTLALQKAKYDAMQELLQQFTVTAPKDGMLIYKKDWNGNKIKVGSGISAWDPAVATLPDLTSMVSKTYVNEIDISKIKKDQRVELSVDAFPQKKYKGKVITIANIGEQLPGNETKVFEVTILLEEKDTLLRPAMTTSNIILTQVLPDVVQIPVDCLYGNDSFRYVFKKEGNSIVKQQVIAGSAGADFVEIKQGLAEGETVYISEPENASDLQIVSLGNKPGAIQNNSVRQSKNAIQVSKN